ncbi:MAG: peptide chain release factor N(5)-glutamine methyltransferase [Rectinema sp.]
MTYRDMLLEAAHSFSSSETPFLDAVLLLSWSLDLPKEKVLAMLPDRVENVPTSFHEMVERRRRGESVAHIRGFREFFGREFLVNDNVLSPRQDTEVLVDAAFESGDALSKAFNTGEGAGHLSVLDMCTGTGAVAVSIAAERPQWRVSASDVSPSALDVARENARRLLPSPSISFIESDLFFSIEGRFDLIAANPPYVSRAQAERLVGDGWKDPLLALDGGIDGMKFVRAIIMEGHKFLSQNGVLLLEMDPFQIPEATALFEKEGFCDIRTWKDLAGRTRVAGAHHG